MPKKVTITRSREVEVETIEEFQIRIAAAYKAKLKDVLSTLEERLDEAVAEAAEQAVSQALGIERDRWDNKIKISRFDQNMLTQAATAAAKKLAGSIDYTSVVLSPVEQKAFIKAAHTVYKNEIRRVAFDYAVQKAREDATSLTGGLDPSILEEIDEEG